MNWASDKRQDTRWDREEGGVIASIAKCGKRKSIPKARCRWSKRINGPTHLGSYTPLQTSTAGPVM